MDTRVGVCKDLLVGVPAQLHAVTNASARALSITKSAHRATTQFTSNGGHHGMMAPVLNRLDDQDKTISTLISANKRLATKNADLEATIKQLTRMLIKLSQEPKQSAAHPPAQMSLPRVEFEAYITRASYDQEMLLQSIKGGGHTIGLETFTVLQDSLTWCRKYLDPDKLVYENFLGLMAVIQMTKSQVVTQKDLETEELHSAKVSRNGHQSSTLVSFQTTFSEQFGLPTGDVKVDFALLKHYAAWNQGDGQMGLRFTLITGFAEQETGGTES